MFLLEPISSVNSVVQKPLAVCPCPAPGAVGLLWDHPNGHRFSWGCRGLQLLPGLIPSCFPMLTALRDASTGPARLEGRLHCKLFAFIRRSRQIYSEINWQDSISSYHLILPISIQVALELSKIKFYHLFCYLPFFAWFICQHKLSELFLRHPSSSSGAFAALREHLVLVSINHPVPPQYPAPSRRPITHILCEKSVDPFATLGRFGSFLNWMCWELCPKHHGVGKTLDLVGHMPALPLSSHDQPELICLYYHL